MVNPTVFYAWQNDRHRGSVRDLIRCGADNAVARIARHLQVSDAPRLDHDTLNESGTPPISETIFNKIRQSALVIADVTFVGAATRGNGNRRKLLPNPNVLLELGYAAGTIGWARIILVMNKHYGSPESLPFDLKNRRFPISYKLSPNSAQGGRVLDKLTGELEMAIQACLSAEYELVQTTLSQLSSYSRKVMRQYGANRLFWETETDNKVSSRLDLAIAQMLELKLIRCVDAVTETGLGSYTWTYLGRQCCRKLGVIPASVALPEVPQLDSVTVDMSAYDQMAADRLKEENR